MPGIDVSSVKSAQRTFNYAENVNVFNDTFKEMAWGSEVDLSEMFEYAKWTGELDLSPWKDCVESANLYQLFERAEGNTLNIEGWKLPSSSNAYDMLDVRLEYINMNGVTFHVDSQYPYGIMYMSQHENKGPLTVDMNNTEWYEEYNGASSIFYYARGSSADVPVYINLRNAKIHQKNITYGMFYALQNAVVDLSNWQFLDNETTLDHMFYSSKNNNEIIGMDTWDWSNISDVSYMFNYSQMESIDLGRFNIPEGCNVYDMFFGAAQLQTVYVNEEFKGLPSVINGEKMLVGTSALIGGAGTKSSEVIKNRDDSTRLSDTVYFRVDGGSASPGLLTLKN